MVNQMRMVMSSDHGRIDDSKRLGRNMPVRLFAGDRADGGADV